LTLYCKGADNVILERLDKDDSQEMIDKTNEYIDEYAKEGLRTLLVAKKDLDEGEYAVWNEEFKKASL